MPLASGITLPLEVDPTFPDKCLVCHQKPDSTLKIIQQSRHWLLAFLIPFLMFFGWSKLGIPICHRCKPKYRFQRWGRAALFLTFAITATCFIFPLFAELTGLAKKAAVVGLVLVVLTPYLMWEIFYPRIFDTNATPTNVTFEFLSAAYALEFLELNRESAIDYEIHYR